MADAGFSPGGGAPTPKVGVQTYFLAENCMKTKEFWPPGGHASLAHPPLDPPLEVVPIGTVSQGRLAWPELVLGDVKSMALPFTLILHLLHDEVPTDAKIIVKYQPY